MLFTLFHASVEQPLTSKAYTLSSRLWVVTFRHSSRNGTSKALLQSKYLSQPPSRCWDLIVEMKNDHTTLFYLAMILVLGRHSWRHFSSTLVSSTSPSTTCAATIKSREYEAHQIRMFVKTFSVRGPGNDETEAVIKEIGKPLFLDVSRFTRG